MQVLDLHHGSVHGLSIPPTSTTSTNQTGVGIDMGSGSLVGHAVVAFANVNGIALVHIQEASVDQDGSYSDTIVYSVGIGIGDNGTAEPLPSNESHMFQYTRSNRWARVKVDVQTNGLTNVRMSAILTSMISNEKGGVSLSPAG